MYWLKDGENLSNNGIFRFSIHDSVNIGMKDGENKEDLYSRYILLFLRLDHIRVSSNGNLRIMNSNMEDAGLYECFTPSGLRGNVTIRFKTRENKASK